MYIWRYYSWLNFDPLRGHSGTDHPSGTSMQLMIDKHHCFQRCESNGNNDIFNPILHTTYFTH